MKKFIKSIFGISSKGGYVRVAIMCIVMGTVIVSFYYMLSKSLSSNEERTVEKVDELNIVMSQDFNNSYPQSPREVVRWYNRIITLYYSQNLNNSQIEKLADQARMLFDRDLLDQNPRDNYLASVKQDISDYKSRHKKIMSTDEGSSADVKYTVVDGYEMAQVISFYSIQENSMFSSSYQTYGLRRDGSGRYKILSFRLTDKEGNPL